MCAHFHGVNSAALNYCVQVTDLGGGSKYTVDALQPKLAPSTTAPHMLMWVVHDNPELALIQHLAPPW